VATYPSVSLVAIALTGMIGVGTWTLHAEELEPGKRKAAVALSLLRRAIEVGMPQEYPEE